MKAEFFDRFDFFAGVPDSQLRALCDYLTDRYTNSPEHHIIAANEGNAVALAAGYHLATGKIPVVYMQNSGEGNAINPLASLMNDKVYAMPCIFVIGWRGEPGVHDEPQHLYQGEVTLKLLDVMGVDYMVIDKNTTEHEAEEQLKQKSEMLRAGKQFAFVIKKGALSYDKKVEYRNDYRMKRETAIEIIESITGSDPIVSTTGKASRELFEIREKQGKGHGFDFLTVGSMGHTSSIALGLAINKPDKTVWCIDGDGALLMHMGAMAVIGSVSPANFKHIVINNCAHETVGGMPTVAGGMDIEKIAQGCGYKYIFTADDEASLKNALEQAKRKKGLCLIEVKCEVGSRGDLGRPTTTPIENKESLIKQLR